MQGNRTINRPIKKIMLASPRTAQSPDARSGPAGAFHGNSNVFCVGIKRWRMRAVISK